MLRSVTAQFLAFDLGAESGRAILGRLRAGVLDVSEIDRFSNEPVRDHGSLRSTASASTGGAAITRSSANAAICSKTRITIATRAPTAFRLPYSRVCHAKRSIRSPASSSSRSTRCISSMRPAG
jgi:hypothetical protein